MKETTNDIPEELLPLIPGFLQRREQEISSLQELLKAKNFAEIAVLGHRLKGSAAGYGFAKLGSIGNEIEKAARKNNEMELMGLVKTYESAVKEAMG